MTLGTPRPRNWGKEAQQIALDMLLKQRKVTYALRDVKSPGGGLTHKSLWLAASANAITLPFTESCAELVNTRRGRWEARHPFDGRVLARGVSERDVVRSVIEAIWH